MKMYKMKNWCLKITLYLAFIEQMVSCGIKIWCTLKLSAPYIL